MSLQRFVSARRRTSGLIAALVSIGLALTVFVAAGATSAVGSGSSADLASFKLSAVVTPRQSTTTAPNGLMIHRISQTPAEVRAYWTAARMATAKSVDVITRSGNPSSVTQMNPNGPAQQAPSWAPSGLSEVASGPAPPQ